MRINEAYQEMKIYHQTIQSNAASVCKEVALVLDQLKSTFSIDEDDRFEVKVILSELLQNAIRHGNKMDENKKIILDVSMNGGDLLQISVLDEGLGFDVNDTLAQKKQKAYLTDDIFEMEEFGRGLMIIETLCDHVYRNELGNQITVKKQMHLS